MRQITTHHDGHGLAETIRLEADEISPDPKHGGASHYYKAFMAPEGSSGPYGVVLSVQFQKGPRNEPGSIPGVIDGVLLAIVEDRLQCFQAGPFPSPKGTEALLHVQAALRCFKARADERAARGVLGKAEA